MGALAKTWKKYAWGIAATAMMAPLVASSAGCVNSDTAAPSDAQAARTVSNDNESSDDNAPFTWEDVEAYMQSRGQEVVMKMDTVLLDGSLLQSLVITGDRQNVTKFNIFGKQSSITFPPKEIGGFIVGTDVEWLKRDSFSIIPEKNKEFYSGNYKEIVESAASDGYKLAMRACFPKGFVNGRAISIMYNNAKEEGLYILSGTKGVTSVTQIKNFGINSNSQVYIQSQKKSPDIAIAVPSLK